MPKQPDETQPQPQPEKQPQPVARGKSSTLRALASYVSHTVERIVFDDADAQPQRTADATSTTTAMTATTAPSVESTAAVGSVIACIVCGFESTFVAEGMIPCERCGAALYCSLLCRDWDITSGAHHAATCQAASNTGPALEAPRDARDAVHSEGSYSTQASLDVQNVFQTIPLSPASKHSTPLANETSRTVSPVIEETHEIPPIAPNVTPNPLPNNKTKSLSSQSGTSSGGGTSSSGSSNTSRVSSATKAPTGQLGSFLHAQGPRATSQPKPMAASAAGVPNPFVISMYEEAESSDEDDAETADQTYADGSVNLSVAMSNDHTFADESLNVSVAMSNDHTFADESLNISVAMSNDTLLDMDDSDAMMHAISEESGMTTEAPTEGSWRRNQTTSFMSKSTDSSSTIAGSFMDSDTSEVSDTQKARSQAVASLHTPYLDFLHETMSPSGHHDPDELYSPHRRKHASSGRLAAALEGSQRSHSTSAYLGGSSADFSDESSVDIGSLELSDDAMPKGLVRGGSSSLPTLPVLGGSQRDMDVPLVSPSPSATSSSTPTPESIKKSSLKSFRGTYNASESSSSSLSHHLERTTSACSLRSNGSEVLRRSSLKEFRDVYHAEKEEEEIYSLYSDGSKSKQVYKKLISPTKSERSEETKESEQSEESLQLPTIPAYTESTESSASMDNANADSAEIVESNAEPIEENPFIGDVYETDDENIQQGTRRSTRGSIDSTTTTSTVLTEPENPSLQSARIRHEMMRNSLNSALYVYKELYGEDAANAAFRQLANTLDRPASKRSLGEQEEQPGGEETFDWKRPRPASKHAKMTTSGTSQATSETIVGSNPEQAEHLALLASLHHDQAMSKIAVQEAKAASVVGTSVTKVFASEPRYMKYRASLSTSVSASSLMSTSAMSKDSTLPETSPSDKTSVRPVDNKANEVNQSATVPVPQLSSKPPSKGYMKYRESLVKSLSVELAPSIEGMPSAVGSVDENQAIAATITDEVESPVVRTHAVQSLSGATAKVTGTEVKSAPRYVQYRVALSQRTLSSCSIMTGDGADLIFDGDSSPKNTSSTSIPEHELLPPRELQPGEADPLDEDDVASSTKRALESIPGFDESLSIHSNSSDFQDVWNATDPPKSESVVQSSRVLSRENSFLGMKIASMDVGARLPDRDVASQRSERESETDTQFDAKDDDGVYDDGVYDDGVYDDDIESASNSNVETPKPYRETNPNPSHKKLCFLSMGVGALFFIGLVILTAFNSDARSVPSDQVAAAPVLAPASSLSIPSPAPTRLAAGFPSLQPLTAPQAPMQAVPATLKPTLSSTPLGPFNPMTNFPSSATASVPLSPTTGGETGTDAVTEQLFAILIPMSFDDIDILNPGSPQYMAFQWLASYPHLFSNYTIPRVIQRFALACLYYSSNGANWSRKAGWLSDASECTWFSAAVNASNCDTSNVYVNLHLGNNSLSGSIPNELAFLTGLEYLNLSRNGLSGTIPSVGLLRRLETMDLSVNRLTGTIPTDIGLPTLTTLDFGGNTMTGSIPSAIGQLTKMVYMDLSNNRLVGPLPEELGRLQNATTIKIHNNDIAGSVSDSICLAFLSFMPIFYVDCRESSANTTNAGTVELACPQGSCCTFCCNDEAGCQCVYENTRFDFICTLGKAYP